MNTEVKKFTKYDWPIGHNWIQLDTKMHFTKREPGKNTCPLPSSVLKNENASSVVRPQAKHQKIEFKRVINA